MSRDGHGPAGRIFGFVRALLPEDWSGKAGERFRRTTEEISQFADEHCLRPKDLLDEGVELGRRKLEGLANKEYAEAVKSFAEGELTNLEAELKRRLLETKVRQDEAAARLAELTVVEKEIDLLNKLTEIGVVLRRDDKGNLTVLPLPPNLSLKTLTGGDER